MNSPDLINGSGALGFGINIFSDLSFASLRNRIIDVSPGERTKTIKGKVYSIPKNADIYDDATTNGDSFVEETRQKYERHFDAKVKASAKICSFKVSASASLSENETSKSSTYYALYLVEVTRYKLRLNSSARAALYDGITKDRDYRELPEIFTEENKHLFFRFFAKFGTHYLSSVTMGGRLFYSVSIAEGSHYSEKEIKAKIEAEYKGIFASGKMEAETAFKEANEEWFRNSHRKVYAEGGDVSIINAISPSFGKNKNDDLNIWLNNLEQEPSIREFTTEPISMIFTGGQAAAVEAALQAYGANRLQAKASARSGAIFLQGRQLRPEILDVPTPKGGRLQVAIIDKHTLAAEHIAVRDFNPKSYDGTAHTESARLYRELYDEVKRYEGNNDYMCIFSAVSLYNQIAPNDYESSQFNTFLQNCGAGSKLKDWREHHSFHSGDPDNIYMVDYILIGSCGSTPGRGIEAMSPYYRTDKQYLPPQPLSLYAFLEGSYDSAGNFKSYEPREMSVQSELMLMADAAAEPAMYEPAAVETVA